MENEQIKQKFPVGMILILVLIGWGIVGLLLGMFKVPPLFQLGSILISGAGAIIVDLVMIGISASIFYGIVKRLEWARKLAIGWSIVSILLPLVNFVSFLGNKTMYDSYYQKILSPEAYSLMTPTAIAGILIPTLVLSSIINLVIIIYLARKKSFFVN